MMIECDPTTYMVRKMQERRDALREREVEMEDLQSNLLREQIKTAELQNQLLKAELERIKDKS